MAERIYAASIANQIVWTHATFITVIQDLTESQLTNQPGSSASPSIAWHFWHAARLADRVQAGLNDRAGHLDRSGVIAGELWALESIASQWTLESSKLGVFEIGSEMVDVFSTFPFRAGKQALLEYASASFSLLNSIVERIGDDELLSMTKTVANFTWQRGAPGSMHVIAPKDVRILDELIFYEGHTSRHLGMVEALCGLLLERGTATI